MTTVPLVVDARHMIVVTGGAGFIGSNLVRTLVARGERVLVVDHVPPTSQNLVGVAYDDWLAPQTFLELLEAGAPCLSSVSAVLHQGACSSTLECDEQYLFENNFDYSRLLIEHGERSGVRIVYASSAAVYGVSSLCREEPVWEQPLNGYARSKLLLDEFVRRSRSRAVGLRYFNVYGPREAHKAAMASVVHQWAQQHRVSGSIELFDATGGFAAGEQRRDFVHVDDIVRANLWFMERPDVSGIFNVGTGTARTYNELGELVLGALGSGSLRYVSPPPQLLGRYQHRTEADLSSLRGVGCDIVFRTIEVGVAQYLDWMTRNEES